MKRTLAIFFTMLLFVTACGKDEQISSVAEVTSEVTEAVNLDDYVGYYTDGVDTEVTIKKVGPEYSMEIFIYGLTCIDEGKVTASPEGVVFDAVDANGDPIKILFYKKADETYAFEVKETTWTYFENDKVFDNLTKPMDEEAAGGKSVLEDGVYYTILFSTPHTNISEYISSIEFTGDKVSIDAVFSKVESDDDWIPVERSTYIILIDSNTKYLAGGGEDDPEELSQAEVVECINQLMDSGLGLRIVIENGYATEMGIWS